METSISISNAEYRNRVDHLLSRIESEGLSGAVLFDNYYILYYTGFAFVPTERPMAFVISAKGDRALFVPRLEAEHARSHSIVQRVDHYLEYPYKPHPMTVLKEMLLDMGIDGEIGADSDGYPWVLGYRGPDLSELMDTRVHRITAYIEEQMMIKSEAEVNLIRESVKWGNLAHRALHFAYNKLDGVVPPAHVVHGRREPVDALEQVHEHLVAPVVLGLGEPP